MFFWATEKVIIELAVIILGLVRIPVGANEDKHTDFGPHFCPNRESE